MAQWTFFTNYGHIMFLIATDENLTLREISLKVGITERATQRIISDLEKDGFIKIRKQGRQNFYKIQTKKKLKHHIEKDCRIGDLIEVVNKSS